MNPYLEIIKLNLDPYFMALAKINSRLSAIVMVVLFFASLAFWRKTHSWPFFLFAVLAAIPLLRTVALQGYAFFALKDLSGEALLHTKVNIIRTERWVGQFERLCLCAGALIGGLAILFSYSSPSRNAKQET